MTNVLLAGFTSHWLRRESSHENRREKNPQALRGCPQRPEPLERKARTNPARLQAGLEIHKNPAEGEVFFVDFSSYRTLQAPLDYFRFALKAGLGSPSVGVSSERAQRLSR